VNSKTKVEYTEKFKSEVKRLFKKYRSLHSDLEHLEQTILSQPRTGESLGNNTYKIRLAIKSKGKGKSGGARVISHVETEVIGIVENNTVTLLTIYDKSEIASLTKDEIQTLIKEVKGKG
jgi:mRNA-degrading endonuclease RelE of RelBE toxin-antitoxin system